MRLLSILCLCAFVLTVPAHSATIRVPAEQPTIQAGINAAIPGDTVLVAPGTYTGADNKELDLKGKAIVLRSEGGAANTIIDCQLQGRGFYFQAGEGLASIVEGLTIKNGRVSGKFPEGWGGGILCIGSSPTIRECVMEGNEAADGNPGGGIACYDSSPQLILCLFKQNVLSGGHGGGAYLRLSAPAFLTCIFDSNSGVNGGAIAAVEKSSASLTDCSFMDNTANAGGAISFQASTGSLLNCTFLGNDASSDGGSVYMSGSSPSFVSCAFESNTAPNGFGGALHVSGSVASVEQCLFRANLARRGGAAYFAAAGSSTVVESSFIENLASEIGGAIGCEIFGSPSFEGCVFVENEANAGGAVLSSTNLFPKPRLVGCTIYRCRGSAIYAATDTVRIERCIIAFSPNSDAVTCNGGQVVATCTDIYANLGGNWTGCIASQLGQNGNFSSNPLFCDMVDRDLRIRPISPCAPANSPPGCGLIGALPVGCGVADVATDEAPSADLRLAVIPNPVRGAARFELGATAPVTVLNIFDLQGRLIEQLHRRDNHWEWMPGSAVPAGVYFARPDAEVDGLEAVKFLYLR